MINKNCIVADFPPFSGTMYLGVPCPRQTKDHAELSSILIRMHEIDTLNTFNTFNFTIKMNTLMIRDGHVT